MFENNKELINYFNNLSEKYSLIDESIESCKKIIFGGEIDINEYLSLKNVDKENFTLDDIIISFYSQSLIFKNKTYEDLGLNEIFPLIETRIKLFTTKNLISDDYLLEIGYYRLLSEMNGECFDDFFVLE